MDQLEDSGVTARPVYILGAGFSRAVHGQMPLTDELGEAIRHSLEFASWPEGGEELTFEQRLTLLSTPLPFLAGHENTRRRALAERVTAALADELDLRTQIASGGAVPLWLSQLVALWHFERAKVITFNYDTLVEQAVTSQPLVMLGSGAREPERLYGSQVAYPAPTPVNVRTFREMGLPTSGSMQLIKLHGSLNWYWAAGDGATVVRDGAVYGFGEWPLGSSEDTSGVRALDRFLIPPVTSKDSYYDVSLAHSLWRSAHAAIQVASRLTIIGYSMPEADRIASELLGRASSHCPVDIVNWDVGRESNKESPIGRARAAGLAVDGAWSGENAVTQYVSGRIEQTTHEMVGIPALRDSGSHSVVASVMLPHRQTGPHSFTLLETDDGSVRAVDLDWSKAAKSTMPPTELSLEGLPRGTAKLEQFFKGRELTEWLASGRPFEFTINQHHYRAVGVTRAELGRWPILHLCVAPNGSSEGS